VVWALAGELGSLRGLARDLLIYKARGGAQRHAGWGMMAGSGLS
jgi:hypothetical protein